MMFIMYQQFIALFPCLILIIAITIMMILIACGYNNKKIFFCSISGLFVSFISLSFSIKKYPIDINHLIRIDEYSIFYSKVIIFFTSIICLFSYFWLKVQKLNTSQFFLLILLSTLGNILLTTITNMSALIIGIELSHLPILGLVSYFKDQNKTLESTIKYIILSGVSSSFLLFGIALTYIGSRGLNFFELQSALNINSGNDFIFLSFGIGMILVSFACKLSLFPFGVWISDIYCGVSSLVLSYFSTLSKLSVYTALIRFFMYIPMNKGKILYFLLGIISFSSMIFGSCMALFEKNFKKLLGYSSISHFGYLTALLLTCNNNYPFFLETIGIYLIVYMASNVGIFFIMSILNLNNRKLFPEDDNISLSGLYWDDPFLSISLTIMLFSLSGIPISLGFISKFFLLFTIINSKLFFLGIGIVISTLLSLYFYLKIIINFYFFSYSLRRKANFIDYIITIPGILVFLLDFFMIFFGFFPIVFINYIHNYIIYI